MIQYAKRNVKGAYNMALTFKGGVHPADSKAYTNKIPIRNIGGCAEHVFPVQQHIGAPLTPTVAVGDRVYVGQKIADAESFVSAPIHSSVSGTVKAIEPRLHANGNMVMSIVIENDFVYEIDENVTPKGEIEDLSAKEIIEIVREAGIVGMGGAGFPTHVKLSPPPDKKITHVIVNGAECEPYLTSDHRAMLERPDQIIYGLRAVMHIFGLKTGYVAIENNKPDAIRAMRAAAGDGIEVKVLKKKYPQGSEKHIIYAVTGREVPSGGLPADVGVVVLNVDTVTSIGIALMTGMPAIRRIVTVSGDAMKKTANFEVRTGTPFRHVFAEAGGFASEPAKILQGGPMMGIAQSSLDVPVTKGTSALLALVRSETVYDDTQDCIRCGRCVKACPMHLVPMMLNTYAKESDLEMCEKLHVADCIECGSCAYICPARKHLVSNIRVAKQAVLAKRRAAAAKK